MTFSTYLSPGVAIQGGGGSGGGGAASAPLTGTGATITTSQPLIDVSQTWNNAAVTFTSALLNVTDNNSTGTSLLMDLGTGGGAFVSKFSVSKFGTVTASEGATANTFSLRNGVIAQTFRLYNTYTDGSNYARGFVRMNSGLYIGTERAGSGAASNGFLQADGLTTLQWGGFGGGFATMGCGLASASPGTYDLGFSAGIGGAFRRLFLTEYIQTVEMTAPAAPAANGVRIYAEDNGLGKTRLMVLFATGAAIPLATEL
jgi:hypothetical protein